MNPPLFMLGMPLWANKLDFLAEHADSWAKTILYITPLRSFAREMAQTVIFHQKTVRFINTKEEFYEGESPNASVIVLTCEDFWRVKNKLLRRLPFKTCVVLDEFPLWARWADSRPAIYETLYQLSQCPFPLLVFSAIDQQGPWEQIKKLGLQEGFRVKVLVWGQQREKELSSLVKIPCPWRFLKSLGENWWRGKGILLYCQTNGARRIWRFVFSLFDRQGNRLKVSEGNFYQQMKAGSEILFLASPLNQEDWDFCRARFRLVAYEYAPFEGDGKRSENVLKSWLCKQKLKVFSFQNGHFKNVMW